jgi:heme-degrading monooxygenase HmoA
MIKIIWAFRVRAASEKEFVAAYGSHGDWARLFAKAPGYHGTQLLKDAPQTQRYLTIDSWDSLTAFDEFKRDFHREYIELDSRFEAFTEIEEPIGVFEVLT